MGRDQNAKGKTKQEIHKTMRGRMNGIEPKKENMPTVYTALNTPLSMPGPMMTEKATSVLDDGFLYTNSPQRIQMACRKYSRA